MQKRPTSVPQRRLSLSFVTVALIVALQFGALSAVHAQRPSMTVTTNPFALVDGRINFEIERALNPNVSGFFGANFLILKPIFGDARDDVFGVGPTLGLRLYFLGHAPEGLFIGPDVEVAYLTKDGNHAVGMGVGGMAGFTWIMYDVLTLSLGAGLAYVNMDVDVGDRSVGPRGVVPRFRFALGMAF